MPKENMYYTCIASITIDSAKNVDKKNHPQVYLEESNNASGYSFYNKLKSYSDSDLDLDSEAEWKSGAKLMAKLEKSDSEWKILKKIYIYNFKNNLTSLVAEPVKSAVKANISIEANQFYLHQLFFS